MFRIIVTYFMREPRTIVSDTLDILTTFKVSEVASIRVESTRGD